MDLVTGAQVAVELPVPVPRERMWALLTDIERIGEFSPEAHDGRWDDAGALTTGARFTCHNRYGDGCEATVTCVVTAVQQPSIFAWAVLDDDGLVGSAWRYELRDGDEPGTTAVRHSFTHGPGNTGLREGADTDIEARDRRLAALCRNMTTTITAMITAENTMGARR